MFSGLFLSFFYFQSHFCIKKANPDYESFEFFLETWIFLDVALYNNNNNNNNPRNLLGFFW
jgi:hypothetical protein